MLAESRQPNTGGTALTARISEERVKRSFTDRLALAIGTCGIGYMPFVPATWGSLLGVGVYLLAQKADENFAFGVAGHQPGIVFLESMRVSLTLVFLIALFLIGIWAATRVEKLTGKKDPRIVVIDEILGQFITLLFIPAKLGWWTIIAGFLAFRFFDILKLYPANKLESLPGGLGAMADDVMAGFYAAAFMSLLCSINLLIL